MSFIVQIKSFLKKQKFWRFYNQLSSFDKKELEHLK